MKKMRKVLSLLLVMAMMVACLAACNSGTASNDATTAGGNGSTTTEAPTKADGNEAQPTDPATDPATDPSKTVTLWVANEVVDFTQSKIDEFVAANPDLTAGFSFVIQPTGEGEAASNMVADVLGGADIFGFAQDQLARLVAAGALSPVMGDYETFVKTENDAGAVGAATVGETVYAFPLTSDNGYFLYYDKSVVTDPSTLEAIVADCEKAGKNFYFEMNSGWYQTAFFFGTGCELTYETNDEGAFVGSNISYNSENGLKALKAMINLASSPAFKNGSSLSSATDVAAIVDGTWDSGAAKEIFKENYACAKLPTFTVDGSTYQMSGFGGFKLLGIKPQTDGAKLTLCYELAKFLSNADTQLARYQTAGWGPSNLTTQANDAIKADPALSALAEQLAFCIPQGQYPNEYWKNATALGDDIVGLKYADLSDEELMAILKDFQEKNEALAK